MLLTDVEGSTVQWEAQPDGMREAMRRHHEIGHAAIALHSGYLPADQGEGDSLFAVFDDVRDGVACAVELQRSLAAETWPAGISIRVRAAIHTGSLDLRDGRNYSGVALNRCARLRGIAHGGQTILSASACSVLGTDLPDRTTVKDLGMHRLKDLSVPEHVFQLCHPDLEPDFPPLGSLDARPNNLPVQLNRFVGRVVEMSELHALLKSTRLLTLTGAGGAGKTRLALQAAADLLDEYADGLWFVELANVSDPELIPRAVASAMRVREQQGISIVDTLVARLAPSTSLLVLDNCEHMIDACAELAQTLLGACPRLCILTTSRESLGVAGEVVWRVPPLTMPTPALGAVPPDELARSEAVQLFVDRAAAVNPRFALTAETSGSTAAICLRLDGIPLAIELAAARLHSLTVDDVRERLDDRFRLLTTGARPSLARHQTLRATVDWSHDLLSESERVLFRRLCVFAGSFTLDATEHVCAANGIDRLEVMDTLSQLVAKSLVAFQDSAGEGRYRLLETVREYGLERLRGASEEARVRTRHLRWCIDFAETVEPELRGADQQAWLDRLHLDLDNFRAAFGWSLRELDPESALRLATALLEFWIVRADWSEGRDWVERAIALPGGVEPGLRAKALCAAAELADVLSDYPAATARFEESLAIARGLGDDRLVAEALMGLAHEADRVGRSREARPLLEEATVLLRRVGDEPSIARSLGGLAWLEENFPRARVLWAEHLAICRTIANREAVGWAVLQVGWAAEGEGDYAAARTAYGESLAIGRELGYKRMVARSMTQLGETETLQGRTEQARAHLEEALPIWTEIGHKSGLVDALRGMGDVARLDGDREEAGSFLDQSLSVSREIGAREAEARALQSMGSLYLNAEDIAGASARFREALALWRDMDHVPGMVACFRGLGRAAAAAGAFDRAARLLGAAETLRARVGAAVPPCEREDLELAMQAARVGRGTPGFEADLAVGMGLPLEAAVELAMEPT